MNINNEKLRTKWDAAKTIARIEIFGGQAKDDSKKFEEAKDEFRRKEK